MQTLGFDDNHLLTIEHPNLSTTKDYAVSFPSYIIKSKDKGILIFNKRQWKILHLKEISEWMQVCYLQENPIENYKINKWMIVNALAIFQWFNEETWEKYYYLPFFSKWIDELQQIINKNFGFDVMINQLRIILCPNSSEAILFRFRYPQLFKGLAYFARHLAPVICHLLPWKDIAFNIA